MKKRKIKFIHETLLKFGEIQGISADFPGYYAIFVVKSDGGLILPVDSRNVTYL